MTVILDTKTDVRMNRCIFPFTVIPSNRSSNDAINLADVSNPTSVVYKDLSIRSGNDNSEFLSYKLLSCDSFTSYNSDLEITDVFKYVDNSLIPIFYVHFFNKEITKAWLTDTDNNIVESFFDSCNYALYTNLKGYYVVHYRDANSNEYEELLNTRNVFVEATMKDYDEDLKMVPTRNVYEIEEGEVYTYKLSRFCNVACRPKYRSNCFLEYLSTPIRSPWRAIFVCKSFTHEIENVEYTYGFPELRRQSFTPHYPYMKIGYDMCRYSGRHIMFSVPYAISTLNCDIYVLKSGQVWKTFSSNPARVTEESCGEISSISNYGAMISEDLPEGCEVIANYHIDVTNRLIYNLDLNPFSNPEIQNMIVLFYSRPCNDTGLFHICFNMDGSVPDITHSMISNDPSNHAQLPNTNRLDNEILEAIINHEGYDTSYDFFIGALCI